MQSISLIGSLVFSLGAHSASDVQTPEMPPDIQSICVAEDIRDRVVIIVQGTKTRESQYGDLTMCNRGEMILETKVSTGRPQRDGGVWTPEGTFEIGHMTRFRRSRTYDNSPMPLAMHLYKGIYIHE